jgi:hypothetical protein
MLVPSVDLSQPPLASRLPARVSAPPRVSSRVSAIAAPILAGLFGLWWFGQLAGRWDVLLPSNTGWLMVADWGAHQMGWSFFRNDAWSWPLGHYTSLLHPIGSTVGFSDSIPIVAIVAKLLSPILPAQFQYFGLWLAACFILQGYFGTKIAARFWDDPLCQLLGGMAFVTTPTLLLRIGHPSLCAHWILLALFGLHVQQVPGRRSVVQAALLTLLSATVHPYLAAMTLVLALALVVRVQLAACRFSWARLGATSGGLLAMTVLVFWVLGYVGTDARILGDNFDRYGADATTLFNSMGYSRHLPALPQNPAGANEGFAYLGLGLLTLTLASLVLVSPRHLRRVHWRMIAPLAVACALLGLFALSPTIRFGGGDFIHLIKLYEPVIQLVHTFRSSGRFIWPLHYLCITFAIAVMAGVLRSHRLGGRVVLGLALALQLADLKMEPSRDRFKASPFVAATAPGWALARGDYDHLALYPPQIYTSGCGAKFDEPYVYRLGELAARLGMTINSGYVARLDLAQIQQHCQVWNQAIAAGKLDDRTIYIVRAANALPAGKAACGQLDGYVACVAAARPTPFRRTFSP